MRVVACFTMLLFFSGVTCEIKNNAVRKNVEENADSFEDHISRMNIDKKKYQIPEIVLGNINAKYNVVVYSSFSCDHCQKFHLTELRNFIKTYVDTGKVKIIFRYFIDDIASFEASAFIVHLSGGDNKIAFQLMEKVFEQQNNWRVAEDQPKFLRQLLAETMHQIRPNKNVDFYLKEEERSLDVRTDLGKTIGGRVILGQKEADKMRIMSTPCLIFNGKFDEYKRITNATCVRKVNNNEPLKIGPGYCHQGILTCDTIWQFCSGIYK